jgi:cyclic di-GMP phosphodiesterase
MIKRVETGQLKVGMYIHDLDSNWLSHNFLRNNFLIQDPATLSKVKKTNLKHVYINTTKGSDIERALFQEDVKQAIDKKQKKIVEDVDTNHDTHSIEQEKEKATVVVQQANKIIHDVLINIQNGKDVEVGAIESISSQLVDSVFRNKDALVSLTRIKDKDNYTFQHSVSVCGLMVNFARALNYDKTTSVELAIGGMLHDIGKMRVPNEVLCKPGKLTDDEFKIIQQHVVYSREMLADKFGVSSRGLDVVAQHHERVDGSGYPLGLKGDEISIFGKMSTIVDVYDALSSARCYKNAWEPTLVLRKLLEWSDHHFEEDLVQKFIICMGVYPIGSLVELNSGKVAIVIERGEHNLLTPRVKAIYSLKQKGYISPVEIDLSGNTIERITNWIAPETLGIDISNFS